MFVWLIAVVVFGVIEAATAGLTSIWFVLGAVAALIASIAGANLVVQIVLFLVVSIVALLAIRPAAARLLYKKPEATNADRVLGNSAKVTEAIDNLKEAGAVYADGKTWTARSADPEQTIARGETVRVLRMEGVKLIVEPLPAPANEKEEE